MANNKRSYRKGNPRGTKSKFNARKYKRYDQVAIRRHAMRMYETGEFTAEIIGQMLGISARSVYRWVSWFKNKGWDAFKLPEPKRKCKLTEEQISEIAFLVLNNTPAVLGFSTNLWTRKIISDEIFKKFDIKLSESSVGRILRRNKITPQKPIRKAYQQDLQAVEEFKSIIFPSLVKKAKKEGALILWGDETQACSDSNIGRTWGKQGETPIIPGNGKKEKINVIGTIDQNGQTQFMTYDCNTDTSVVISFIDMLAKKYKEKIYIILDNAIYHKSKELLAHIERYHKGWLELVYLPPYSPELNPSELIWAHLKSHGLNRILTKTKEKFLEAVNNHLTKFSNDLSLGKSVFGKKELAFITEQMPHLLAA